MKRFSAVFVTPPAVFVAVLIGGGYGTGREIVEFFSRHGFWGGIAGLLTSLVLFALILGLTFDAARRWHSYDYVSFFKELIGPVWWLFEVLYLLLTLLVLAVLSAAAGDMLLSEYALNADFGLGITMLVIALMLFFGRSFIERALTWWTAGMYAVFAVYFIFVFNAIAPINTPAAGATTDLLHLSAFGHGMAGGALYVMYNVSVAPVLLFATRQIQHQSEAYLSALVTSITLLVPALLFHLSFSGAGGDVVDQSVPVYWMIGQYAPSLFRSVFVIVLLGTLVQTGVGLIHGFIERVEQAWAKDESAGLSGTARVAIASAVLIASWALAKLGIITLIASGYTALGVGFALTYVLPLVARFIKDRWRTGDSSRV